MIVAALEKADRWLPRIGLLVLFLSVTAVVTHAQPESQPIATEAARNLAYNCLTCHGPGGRSPGVMPSLAGLKADYIATRLRDFKSGVAPSTVMGRQAKGYSDAEIEAVAKYIAGMQN